MAEDINIGADASQAIGEMRKLESAVISAMQAAGASTKQLNSVNRSLEASFAKVAAAAVQSAQKTSSAMKGEVQSTEAAIKAAEKLAKAREQATAKTGLAQNSSGQTYSTSTGRFVGKDQKAQYEQEIALQQRLIDKASELESMRARNAQREQARSASGVAQANAEAEAYRKRQAELERAFSGRVVGIANPDASGLQKFANVLNQIPPASWNRRLNDAGAAIMNMSNSTRYALYEVANSATIAGAAFIAFGAMSIGAAVAHERAFANVARTTQTTTEGYEVLRRQLEVMSMELPVTYEELTNIATAAGQLGIGASGIASFTHVVAQLTATTNLTSEAAGIALARFRTFFSEVNGGNGSQALAVTESTFSNLASSILKVGVNSIASETGIVNVAVQIASMGDYAGLTANQVIGLAGALSSIGVAPELARGTITRTFSLIGNAVSDGGVQLEKFANLAGVSSQQFADAWGTEDFANIFTRVMRGISEYGGDANLMLQELGFNSVRDRPLLLRLAGAADEAGKAGGLLAQTLADAYAGWTENAELALQYSKISSTTSARIQVLGQAFEQLAASMGQQSGGFLGDMAVQLTAVVRGFEAFSNTDAGQVLGSIAVQGSLAVGALLLIIGAASRTVASIQAIGQTMEAVKVAGASTATTLSVAFRALNATLGVIGIVGSIAAVIGGFVSMNDAANKAQRGVQDFGGLVAAMKLDADSGARGVTFLANSSEEAANEQAAAAAQARGMTEALYGVSSSALSGSDGMDDLAASTERAKYVFGDAAKEFYRSQLMQSDAFQRLFNPNTQFARDEFNVFMGQGRTLEQLGLNPSDLDWDKFMEDSLNGGLNTDKLLSDLMKDLDISKYSPGTQELTKDYVALRSVVDSIGGVFQDVGGEIQGNVDAQEALQGQSQKTFDEIYDGATDAGGAISQLDEVTQKTIDNIAKGFAAFADTGDLIGLTQKMNEIFSQEDGEGVNAETKAAQWEQAWSDAYGGAAFSLEEYLGVFRRAGQEQSGFIENLTSLRDRVSSLGLSDAFINDLAQMGPEANRLVQALVTGTDEQLVEFETLWGQTGYDSMILFATQAEIGKQVTTNVLRNAGLDGLRAFNASLSSGVGTKDALAALQLDVNGNPIKPAVSTPVPPWLSQWEKDQWARANQLYTTASVDIPTLDSKGTKTGTRRIYAYADGGYTGPGTKYQEAGIVHAGEFVMNAEATRAIGVNNLYAMMRAASGGRAMPRGKGYAQGGIVSNSGSQAGYITSFGPMAVQQMMQAFRQYINLDGKQISDNSASQYRNDSVNGAY